MFADFYVKAYTKPKKQKRDNNNSSESNGTSVASGVKADWFFIQFVREKSVRKIFHLMNINLYKNIDLYFYTSLYKLLSDYMYLYFLYRVMLLLNLDLQRKWVMSVFYFPTRYYCIGCCMYYWCSLLYRKANTVSLNNKFCDQWQVNNHDFLIGLLHVFGFVFTCMCVMIIMNGIAMNKRWKIRIPDYQYSLRNRLYWNF